MGDWKLPDRFRILEEVSRDDAEILLRVRDELLKREVVIQVPRPEPDRTPDDPEIDRALRQARALARVRHPFVIRLLDVLETPSGPALVTEPVAGETLRDVVAREGRLAPDAIRTLAIRLCEALEAVHSAGVVHRGISTSNVVLLSDGTPCLTGFAFAKFAPGASSLHATSFNYVAMRGGGPGSIARPPSPPHPAPEQILGQTADARSDVFGLGWVLYECLTGEHPYPFEQEPDAWPPPPNPRRRAPEASKGLSDVVLRCLSPSPLKRFAAVGEVRLALEASARPEAAVSAPPSTPRRSRTLAISGGILAVGAVLGWRFGLLGKRDPGVPQVEAADGTRGLLPKSDRTNREDGGRAQLTERYEHSLALLIGIGEVYAKNGFPALPNAERDVAALADRLRAIAGPNDPWSVEVLAGADASRDGILARLDRVKGAATENDKIFVYYAGHGAKHELSEKSGWIIPADGVSEATDPSRKTWVRFDELGHLFDESRSKHVLVAMDCCYGGRLVTSRSVPSAAFKRRFLSEPAKIIISSGRANEQVSDGARGENSPFARAFLDALSRTDVEAVTTMDIFEGVRTRFLQEEVPHDPVRGNPPGAPQAGDVVFFLK